MFLTRVSFNVNWLRNDLKRKTMIHFLEKKKFDFILLPETHSNSTDEKLQKSEWGGDIVYSHGNNHGNGMVILVKKSLKYKRITTYIDQAGRILLIEISNKVFVIGDVHAHTKDIQLFGAFFSAAVDFLKHDLAFEICHLTVN